MILGDLMYMWSYGPMCEVAEDPMHLADIQLVGLAGMMAFTDASDELAAANERMHRRQVWCYEEGGRRYAAALRAYRMRAP